MTEPSSSTATTAKMKSSIDPELWAKMTVQHLRRHGVGADKKTSYKLTEKVDQHGNYLEFPNLTVIHPLSPSEKLANLPLRLQQIAGVFVSPLPSYHATLLCGPLHIEMNGPQHQEHLFAECLQEPCWERMAQYLASKQYAPSNLRVGDVVCKASGGVTIYLQETVEDDNVAQTIRDELRQIGVCTSNLRASLKVLSTRKDLGKKACRTAHRLLTCLMEPKERAWHLTIAYPRKSGGAMSEELQEQVRAVVLDAFHTETENGILAFAPAQLCLSTDMTTFVPWNGKCPRPSAT